MSAEAQAPQAPAIAEAVEATPQQDGKKVFVGNLSFKTTEEELRTLFHEQGTINEATVITRKYSRGTRSLGYAFVTFATESEAQAAIAAMDKKEVDGRQINCEIAKPPSSTPRGQIAKEAAEAANNGEPVPPAAEGTASRGRGGRRGRGKGKGRRSARGRRAAPADGEADVAPAEDGEATNNGPSADGDTSADNSRGSGRRGRGGRGRGRGGRPARRGPPSGEASKTLVFVSNLPFSVDNDGLKAIFDGCQVKSAHVVTRKRGPISGLSKGFGFVDFENETEQQKVLSTFNGKDVDGRQISLKVAIDSPEQAAATGADPSGDGAPEAAPAVPALS